LANPIATEVIVGQITAGSGFTGSTNTTNVCPIAANYEINATNIMEQRKRGPKPKGQRKERITVKYHDSELVEILAAFADNPEHPATWLRNKSLEYARSRHLQP
jgi:hypothetical protein